MTASDFQRVGEFFDGQERLGSRTVLRTQPEWRPGCYFVVALEGGATAWPEGVTAVLEVIPAGAVEPMEFAFTRPAQNLRGNSIWIGVTGSDWPGPRVQPLAWRVRWVGPNEQMVGEWTSFLWERA